MSEPPFLVDSYGGIGDGSNDDTLAWHSARAAAIAAGGGVVTFTPGRHYMLNDLDLSPAASANVALHLQAVGSILEHNHPNGGVFANFSGDVGTGALFGCSIDLGWLYAKNSSTNPTTDIVYCTYAQANRFHLLLKDPYGHASGSGLHIFGRSEQGVYYNEFDVIMNVLPGRGLHLDGYATQAYVNSNYFPRAIVLNAGGIGYQDDGGNNNAFGLLNIEACSGVGMSLSADTAGLRVLNGYLESNNGGGRQWSLQGQASPGSLWLGRTSPPPTPNDVAWWTYFADGASSISQFSGQLASVLLPLSGTTMTGLQALTTGPNAVGPGSETLFNPYGGLQLRRAHYRQQGTLSQHDVLVDVDASRGAFVLRLPKTAADGECHTIAKLDDSGHQVTIDGNGHNILGAPSYPGLVAQWSSATFVYSSTAQAWLITAKI